MILKTTRSLYRYVRYNCLHALGHAWVNVFGRRPIKFSNLDYDEYWDGEHSKGYVEDPRRAVFLRIVEPGSRVIEIGCGDGTLLAALQSERSAVVKGYDVSSVAVEKTRAKGVDAEVRDAIKSWPREATLPDYIIIADCLEHLPNPEDLLRQFAGNFNKAVLISIPNSCYWRYRLRVMRGSFMVQWVAHPGEHLRFWSISDMHWWLNQLGFEARQTYPTWGIPFLKRLWPSMFAQNVVYVITELPAGGHRSRP